MRSPVPSPTSVQGLAPSGFLVPAASRNAEHALLATGGLSFTFEVVSAGGEQDPNEHSARGVCRRLAPRFREDPEALDRMETEARVLAHAGGHGAPRLLAHGRDEHGPFVVMSFVDASPLTRRLEGPRPAAAWLEEAARRAFLALVGLHERGILHGDVSPSNILIDESALSATFVDFGLATIGGMRPSTTFRGTLAYVAPEVARGEGTCSASDLFGLAASFLHLFTGRPPRSGNAPAAMLVQAGESPIELEPLRAVGSPFALALCAYLTHDPASRPLGAAGVVW